MYMYHLQPQYQIEALNLSKQNNKYVTNTLNQKAIYFLTERSTVFSDNTLQSHHCLHGIVENDMHCLPTSALLYSRIIVSFNHYVRLSISFPNYRLHCHLIAIAGYTVCRNSVVHSTYEIYIVYIQLKLLFNYTNTNHTTGVHLKYLF